MKSKAFNLLLALVSVLIWIAQTTDAQNITNFMVVHENKTHVLVSASVDPVSNTYTFDWLVSVNGGSDETLIQVGINGAPGMVMTNNRNPAFNFDIINIPSQLMPSNRPFVSELNYTFNCGERTLVFKVEASPLSISTNEIAAPRCPMTVDGRNVSCSDGSEDCFCPGSNIPGIISCSYGIIITVHCNDNRTFEPPSCPKCPMIYQGMMVSCSNGSDDCFYPNSNITGQITCPDQTILTAYCNNMIMFNFSDCKPTTPRQTMIPTTTTTTPPNVTAHPIEITPTIKTATSATTAPLTITTTGSATSPPSSITTQPKATTPPLTIRSPTKPPTSQNSVSSGGAMNVIGIFAWFSTFCGPLLYLIDLIAVATTITTETNF